MNGKIKRKTDRGFGFISQPNSDKDLFFHSNDLQGISFDEIQEGMEVTFEVENSQKGPSAKNVRVTESREDTKETEPTKTDENDSSSESVKTEEEAKEKN